MLKDKIKALIKCRGIKLIDCFEVMSVSSKSAMTNKITNNRISLSDLIKLCDKLNCEVVVRDKQTGNDVTTFDMSDL